MTDEPSFFGDEPREADAPEVVEPRPAAEWQRDLIRKALDARGLTTMDERQPAVQEAAGRTVASLVDLTHDEAISLLNRLGKSASARDRSLSTWDSRDEDTWIDRL